jgi:two-component system chemotaxis sensor kinase CheA
MANAGDPAQTFRQEAADLLLLLEETLLDLEAEPQEPSLIDKAFRALHTIKGSGSMFGYTAVADFTHHLETAFDQVRSHQRPISASLISLTLHSLDHIRGLIEAPTAVDSAKGAALLEALREIGGPDPTGVTALPVAANAEPPQPALWRIRFRPGPEVMSLGSNPLLLLNELRSFGPATVTPLSDSVPPLEEMDPYASYLAWDILLTTERPRSEIEDVFMFVIDESQVSIERLDGTFDPEKRVGDILVERGDVAPTDVVEALAKQRRIGSLLVEDGKTSPDHVESALAEQQHLRERARSQQVEAQTVRVQADRLDSLMDQVGELVIAQARLRQVAGSAEDLNLRSIAEEIERLAADLRDTTMSIRMLPIGTLFSRFRRLVRDLSQSLGKSVALTTAGEDTELDKTVIESLNDPLVHLIRNALDHGLEDAETRVAAGKPAEGRVQLTAVHSGAQVLITVGDDGRGLDREAIRHKAEERGLIAPGAELSDSDLFALIFEPGFSTAKAVSSLSGRGVGMDVVRQAITALRGTIDVASTPGAGTRVTLKLPLTLAIIDGLLVRIGTGFYVLPLAAVDEVVDLTVEQDAASTGRSFLNIRGDIVPFVRLRELFNTAGKADRFQKVVIVASAERRVGLVVDQVIGQYQTVIKSLSQLLDDVEGFSGATILGDGSVALILDVPHLINFAQERESALRAS